MRPSLPRAGSPETSDTRILVVAGDSDVRASVQHFLGERYHIEAVPDGQAGVEAIGAHAPDLVLAAARMPRLDAPGLLREIRSRSSTSQIPVILLCGDDDEEWRIEGLEAGADDYLTRPFGGRELLARVDLHLTKSRLRNETARRERESRVRAAERREALRAGDDLFRTFVRQSRDGIIIIDRWGTILEWNEGEEQISGIPRSEAVTRPIWEVQHRLAPDEHKTDEYLRSAREKALRGLQEGVNLTRTLEVEIQRPDGTRRIVQSILFGIQSDGNLLVGGICRDITERKRLEQDLRERQALLSEAEGLARVGHWDRDLRRGRMFWSDEVYRVLGHLPRSCSPSAEAFLEAVAPEDRERIAEAMNGTARDGATRRVEFRVVTAQGAVHYVHGSVELLQDAGGVPARLIGTVQDVTDRKRGDERLRANEERLSLAISASGQGLWDWDLAADRAYLSPEYLRLSGYTDGEVPSARAFFRSIVHPDDFPLVEKTMEEHLQGKSPRSAVEYRMRRRSGEYHWIQGVGQVTARDNSGAPLRMTGVITDITERKHLEEELRERQALLLEAERLVHLGHWDRDLRSGLSFWSDEVYRILGHAPGSILPSREAFLEALAPEDRERIAEAVSATAQDGVTRRAEYRVIDAQGAVRSVSGTVELLRDFAGAPARIIGTVQDITERKLMEQEIADANRRKDEFLAVLSHELRNPLAPVHSSLYVLARTEPGGEQARRMQAIIERQVSYLTRLVDDLLDVTRISRGKIQLQRERIELGELVRRTVEDHRSAFSATGVHLEGRTALRPMWLTADPTRIAQIIGNLLTNAAKFTPSGGRIDVTLEQDGDDAVLRVRDTGVGITPETLGQLFEPFMQADRTLDRARGGLGLGLALVKGLAELHGGSVSGTSEGPGRGAEFTVRFPLEAAVENTVAAEKKTRPPRPRRVLIIEDNVDAAGSLKEALELDGHEVQVGYDGSDGLTKARAFQPEVVLCDIGLPDMDGYEVARAFRADDAIQGSFLVALTGYALPEDVQRAQQAGFQRHLVKPPSFEKLLELLAEAPPDQSTAA